MIAARLVELLALNAAAATLLAAIVLAAVAALPALRRRPALVHGLWLLVLLVLLAPPGIRLVRLPSQLRAALLPSPFGAARDVGEAAGNAESAIRSATPPAQAIRDAAGARPAVGAARVALPALTLTIWLLGAIAMAGLALARWRRFRRLLGPARAHAPRLGVRVECIAHRLGLRTAPRIVVVDAPLSPAVWRGPAGPRLLVPAALVAGLDDDQLDTLLTHELVHLRRGDPWVRWLELAAAVVFWWHPLLPAIRRRLREAEEAACDAAVVAALPDSRPAYARALLATVESIAASPRALPATVAGAAEAARMKERLTMILDSPVHAGLTRAQRAALVLAAIATVTLAPAIAEPTGPSHAAPPTGGVVVHDPVRSDTGLVEGDTSADARAVEGDTSADARAVEGDTSADARAVEGDISRERNAAEREREVTARQRSAADELQRLRRREAALTLELERVRVEAERVRRTIGRGAAAGAAESDERRALEERLEVTAAEEAEAAGMARRSAVDRARTHDRLALTEAELAETLAREAERNPVDPHRIERLKALLDRARELHDAEGDEGDTLLELQREVERLEHGSRQY